MAAMSVVAVALAALAQQPAGFCGIFSGCTNFQGRAGAASTNTTVTFQGYMSGFFQVQRVRHNGSDCSGPLFSYSMEGAFEDIGAFQGNTLTRRVYYNYAWPMTVTPLSSDGAALLWSSCPCGNANNPYAVNSDTTLPACPAGTCDGWLFGGLSNTTSPGMVLGRPAFGTINVSADGLSLGMSRVDETPAGAFDAVNNPANYSAVTVSAGNTCASSQQDDICGSFETDCRPVVDPETNNVVGSIGQFTLTYRGPAGHADLNLPCDDPTTQPCPTAWGVFNRTGTAYSDENCVSPILTFTERGEMANLGRGVFGNTGSAYAYGRQSRAMSVTVLDADYASTLALSCPCTADLSQPTWVVNQTRTVTLCPDGTTCDASALWWNDYISFGFAAYAAGSLNVTTIPSLPDTFSTFALTNWTSTYSDLAQMQQQFASGREMEADAQCANSQIAVDYCGYYVGDCLAEVDAGVDVTYDVLNAQESYNIGGDNTVSGATDGTILFTKQYFNNTGSGYNGTACQTSEVSVIARGFFSVQDLPSNAYPFSTGYQSVVIQYQSLSVTPLSQAWVDKLTNDCPCGGAWTAGVTRKLTFCDGGCASLVSARVFPGGAFGSTGFGVIQLTAGQLRVTPLAADSAAGVAWPFNASTTVVPELMPCDPPARSDSLCGSWDLPCHTIGDVVDAQYASSGVFVATGQGQSCSECFYANTTYYTGQTGCEENSPSAYLNVEQTGHYGVQGPANPARVANGNNIIVTTQLFAVTPLSQQAVTDLNAHCLCGDTWALNTVRTFTSLCDPSECDFPLVRQVVGQGTTYGSFQHLGPNVRFTRLEGTPADGWNGANLSASDYQYVNAIPVCNPHLPITPDGPNPNPSPAKTAPRGMEGGDVFLLLLFLTIVVYFGGGMAYNYKQSGVPVIPHVDFWRGLPGLAADGCQFTFVQWCGNRRGVVPRYTDFGGAPASEGGGYGAL